MQVDVQNPSDPCRDAVVKLFVVSCPPSFYRPWTVGAQQYSSGSACVIAGERLLTSAHLVAHCTHIQALKWNASRKYEAKVAYIDHDSELAILTVADHEFWAGTHSAPLGSLPCQNSQLYAYGFPTGGNQLSITTGIVSRIEARTYVHSQRFLLCLQTDAALKPGNSGGPVFDADKKLIGIVFQGDSPKEANRGGYIIPTPLIEHFLTDIVDGIVSGIPDLGVLWQKIENDSLRDYLSLTKDGVLVSTVVFGSSGDGAIHDRDVITSIDSYDVASDGSVLVDNLRVHFTHLISMRQIGERVDIGIVREGQEQTVSVVLRPVVAAVSPPRPSVPPRYFIFAGLVFIPLTYEYMDLWGFADAHFRLKYFYYDRLPNLHSREVVMLSQILAHRVNIGYHHMWGVEVRRVNGANIGSMEDLVRAFSMADRRHHVVEIDNHGMRVEATDYMSAYGNLIVLDARHVESANAEILAEHRIHSDRSDDLRG